MATQHDLQSKDDEMDASKWSQRSEMVSFLRSALRMAEMLI
jgi:hypothetical protein